MTTLVLGVLNDTRPPSKALKQAEPALLANEKRALIALS